MSLICEIPAVEANSVEEGDTSCSLSAGVSAEADFSAGVSSLAGDAAELSWARTAAVAAPLEILELAETEGLSGSVSADVSWLASSATGSLPAASVTEGWRLGSCSGDMKSGLRTNSCPSAENATSGHSTLGGQSN